MLNVDCCPSLILMKVVIFDEKIKLKQTSNGVIFPKAFHSKCVFFSFFRSKQPKKRRRTHTFGIIHVLINLIFASIYLELRTFFVYSFDAICGSCWTLYLFLCVSSGIKQQPHIGEEEKTKQTNRV